MAVGDFDNTRAPVGYPSLPEAQLTTALERAATNLSMDHVSPLLLSAASRIKELEAARDEAEAALAAERADHADTMACWRSEEARLAAGWTAANDGKEEAEARATRAEAALGEILDGLIASRNDIAVDDWIDLAAAGLGRPQGNGG